jgi:hypothetical protein
MQTENNSNSTTDSMMLDFESKSISNASMGQTELSQVQNVPNTTVENMTSTGPNIHSPPRRSRDNQFFPKIAHKSQAGGATAQAQADLEECEHPGQQRPVGLSVWGLEEVIPGLVISPWAIRQITAHLSEESGRISASVASSSVDNDSGNMDVDE